MRTVQLNIFDPAPGIAGKRTTSRVAAEQAAPRTGTQRRRVLAAIQLRGPVTREHIAEWTQLPDNSVRPRVRELLAAGLIAVVPHRHGQSRAGKPAELLAVTQKGYEALL